MIIDYEFAIRKAQGLERSAMRFMDKAARDANRFGDAMEYMAQHCVSDMESWYKIARRIARGEKIHFWDIPETDSHLR